MKIIKMRNDLTFKDEQPIVEYLKHPSDTLLCTLN